MSTPSVGLGAAPSQAGGGGAGSSQGLVFSSFSTVQCESESNLLKILTNLAVFFFFFCSNNFKTVSTLVSSVTSKGQSLLRFGCM